MSKVTPLISAEPNTYQIVTHLQDELPNIESIFLVVKTKKGDFYPCVYGMAGDIAFAALMLQQEAAEAMK